MSTINMSADEISKLPWTGDLMALGEFKEWVASRKDAGAAIDIATCEIAVWGVDLHNPYCIPGYHEMYPGMGGEAGTLSFVRGPGSRGWVHAGDLPPGKYDAMSKRLHAPPFIGEQAALDNERWYAPNNADPWHPYGVLVDAAEWRRYTTGLDGDRLDRAQSGAQWDQPLTAAQTVARIGSCGRTLVQRRISGVVPGVVAWRRSHSSPESVTCSAWRSAPPGRRRAIQ